MATGKDLQNAFENTNWDEVSVSVMCETCKVRRASVIMEFKDHHAKYRKPRKMCKHCARNARNNGWRYLADVKK